jgi:hypothetical protein
MGPVSVFSNSIICRLSFTCGFNQSRIVGNTDTSFSPTRHIMEVYSLPRSTSPMNILKSHQNSNLPPGFGTLISALMAPSA